ncbi:hypothetical protein TWF718_006489 [Orbilia javanica]|uniref:BTB domain-containing protein n=1 Tax=Orbilia javanica TaxID=47235 RepID=A0AAN8RPR9_9PEZI
MARRRRRSNKQPESRVPAAQSGDTLHPPLGLHAKGGFQEPASSEDAPDLLSSVGTMGGESQVEGGHCSQNDTASKDSLPIEIPDFTSPPIEIVEDYDLIILACPYEDSSACTEILQFLVSKHAISISSPIFKALLAFGESDATNETDTLQLYCDNPSAFSIIFRIIHFCPVEDLFDLDFKSFVRIAILCEEYELHNALRPWMYIWSQKYSKHALDPGYEDWLYISKKFGSGEKLEELVNILANECGAISDCGAYLFRGEKKALTKNWPRDILGK